MGPSIKYVTLFLADFDPPPPVTHPGTPKSTSHISDPSPHFSRPSTKEPGQKTPVQILSKLFAGVFCPGGFVRGSFVRKVLFGVRFVHYPFCQNTSVTTER